VNGAGSASSADLSRSSNYKQELYTIKYCLGCEDKGFLVKGNC